MFQDILQKLGFSTEQIAIYESLLEHGPQSAGQLAKSTKVKRTYIYAVCAELLKRDVITQKKQGGTTLFHPNSPEKLVALAKAQKEVADEAEQALGGILPLLASKFSLLGNKPVVTYYEGVEGIKKVYDQINSEQKDIILFRSLYDAKSPQVDEVVMRQIEKQIANGIHTRTITPFEPEYTKENFLNQDKSRLVERHIVRSQKFTLPAQILICGSKVASISLKKEIVATLIDNQDISDTFKTLFELMWEMTQAEHDQIVNSWKPDRDHA